MARDGSAQKMGGGMGIRFDVGTYSFVTSATTVELPTALTTVLSAVFTIEDDRLSAASDRVVTAGSVTVTRAGSGTSGAKFSYIMSGY